MPGLVSKDKIVWEDEGGEGVSCITGFRTSVFLKNTYSCPFRLFFSSLFLQESCRDFHILEGLCGQLAEDTPTDPLTEQPHEPQEQKKKQKRRDNPAVFLGLPSHVPSASRGWVQRQGGGGAGRVQ